MLQILGKNHCHEGQQQGNDVNKSVRLFEAQVHYVL